MEKNEGFTLLEILISIGILAIVSTLMAQVLFTTTHVNKKTELVSDIKQNGSFALDVIARMVRSARSIDVCEGGELQITNPNNNNKTTFKCFLDGTAARIASESASHPRVYLTSGNVSLSSSGDCNNTIAFACSPSVAPQNQVTVTFTLGQLGVAGSAFESGKSSFQSTIGLRN